MHGHIMSDLTAPACSRRHRPNCCPVKNDCDGGSCEIRTLSASQISSALVLLLTLGVYAYEGAATADPQHHDFAFHAALFFVGTVAYYFISSWQIEEEYIIHLRSLQGGYAWAEYLVRVCILGLLGAASLIFNLLSECSLNGVAAELAFLIIVFLGFMVWDGMVAYGAPNEDKYGASGLAWRFLKTDFIGALIILICLGSALFELSNLRAFSTTAALFFVGWLGIYSWPVCKELFGRLKSRDFQR